MATNFYNLVIFAYKYNTNQMVWTPPLEKDENPEEKMVCDKCGSDTFWAYIKIIIDDARLYCAKCGENFLC